MIFSSKRRARLLLITLALCLPLHASEGDSTYIVVLRDAAATGRHAEPELQSLGGRLLRADGNRRLVMLSDAAARELEQHPRVSYVQRIWDGREPALRSQTEGATVAPDRVAANADVPGWQTGAYSYDRVGNVKAIGADHYAYDSSARVIRATVSGKNEEYQYDWFGNLRMPDAPAIAPATNRVAGAAYDAAGNLVSDGRGAHRYDAVSMMTGHTPTASTPTAITTPRRMIYTADDERIAVVSTPGDAQAQTTRITVRDLSGKVLREFEKNSVATEWRRDYVYDSGRLVAGERQAPNGQTGVRHFHLDHLGSTRLITRAGDAARISDPKYFPFGNEADSSTDERISFKYTPLEPMKFTGHERDYYGVDNVPNDDHIDYMHARYYSASAGRFLSVDPVWISADFVRPQSWNRYSYVMNDPLNMTDPDGKCPVSRTGRPCVNPLNGTPLVLRTEKHNNIMGEFGMTRNSGKKAHQGVDLLADRGTRVTAADGGKVVFAGEQKGHGNILIIAHPNAAGDHVSFTSYSHLDSFSVEKGDTVKAGEEIGRVGRSGNLSAGIPTHLHFEIRKVQEPGKGEEALERRVDPGPELHLESKKKKIRDTK
jgi:RHS repeat-associated protein